MIGGYSKAPLLAWSGWRLRNPGGPFGGQYHGFIAPDSAGWPAGRAEIYRPGDTRGLGAWPRQAGSGTSLGPWSNDWGGTALNEGETHSDHIYRSTAEIRPRANASGGAHVVRSLQTRRSAGYAVAPGNYRGIGGLGWLDGTSYAGKTFAQLINSGDPNVSPNQQTTRAWKAQGIPFQNIITTDGKSVAIRLPDAPSGGAVNVVASAPTPVPIVKFPTSYPAPVIPAGVVSIPDPAAPNGYFATMQSGTIVHVPPNQPLPDGTIRFVAVPSSVGATATVQQPPPPLQPVSSPAVPVYSAPPVSPQPAPTVAASPANFLPSQGLVVPGITPGATTTAPAATTPLDLSAWLASSTIIPNIANQWVVLGGVAAAFFLFSGKTGRR